MTIIFWNIRTHTTNIYIYVRADKISINGICFWRKYFNWRSECLKLISNFYEGSIKIFVRFLWRIFLWIILFYLYKLPTCSNPKRLNAEKCVHFSIIVEFIPVNYIREINDRNFLLLNETSNERLLFLVGRIYYAIRYFPKVRF